MKKIVKLPFKIISLVVILVMAQSMAFGKEYFSKKITKTVNGANRIAVAHKYGPLQVQASEDGQVHLEAFIALDATQKRDAEEVFQQFDIQVAEGGGELAIRTIFDVKTWNQSFGTTKIRFKDGTKITDIRNLKISMVIKIPKTDFLRLANKYENIVINDNLNTDLEVNLYEGSLEAKDINGHLGLYLKYSKANFGHFQDAYFELYECNINGGNGQIVEINSKYSKMRLGDMDELQLEAYEGRVDLGIIKGEVTLNSKYSEWDSKSFGDMEMNMYEGTFSSSSGKSIKGEAKYSHIVMDDLGGINMTSLYETDIEVKNLGDLISKETKYCNYDIGRLGGRISANTYEGKIEIDELLSSFEGAMLTGKYTSFKIPIGSNIQCRLEADLQYVGISYNEDHFSTSKYIEKNDKINMEAKSKNASDSSPLFKIVAYEGTVSL